MKIELNSLVGKIIDRVKEYLSRQEQISLEYQRAYTSCFEGSEDEMRRKLEIWDQVHRITRDSSYKGGLFY